MARKNIRLFFFYWAEKVAKPTRKSRTNVIHLTVSYNVVEAIETGQQRRNFTGQCGFNCLFGLQFFAMMQREKIVQINRMIHSAVRCNIALNEKCWFLSFGYEKKMYTYTLYGILIALQIHCKTLFLLTVNVFAICFVSPIFCRYLLFAVRLILYQFFSFLFRTK